MTERGRVRTWGIIGASAAAVAVAGIGYSLAAKPRAAAPPAKAATVTGLTADSPLRTLSRAIARGDGRALAILKTRCDADAAPKPEAKAEAVPPATITDAEVADFADALASLRAGLSRFSAYGRASAVVVASELLHKLGNAPAPESWADTLQPASDVFALTLADSVWEVRVAALAEVKGFWPWHPRRDLMPGEIKRLGAWKTSLLKQATPRLTDAEPRARGSAVACVGAYPANDGAAPAAGLLSDPDPAVRLQVLISFAGRPDLVTEEAILPLLHDPYEMVPTMAERILKARGLSPEQIALGKLVANPRPDMRASAIPFLKDRADVDPTIWLIHLSRDMDESVRLKAIEALAARPDAESKARLAEMASRDVSPEVREAAGKHVGQGDATASLPPLPASGAGLKLKAN